MNFLLINEIMQKNYLDLNPIIITLLETDILNFGAILRV